MSQHLVTIGSLAGGLGLFLLAVKMITDGLRVAAGEALRDILGRWTSTPARGIAAGILITGIVQSSSAVTVATIGFVNAGLLSLFQALGVVYGANVGTTMTGWLVAAMGFKIKVEIFALPLIGLGMLLRLTGAATRRGAIGEALAGFGLFFIGIDVLKTTFEGLAATVQLQDLGPAGPVRMLIYVAIGFMMTLLTQSSSAAIAITLTAATGGILTLGGAAAMVIGANVGTTSTAALAVIGATANAKRVAAAHVLFNVATGAVALALLPAMLWMVATTGRVFGLQDVPAVSLALFHTVFNVLGVLLMWPVSARLAMFLAARFQTMQEIVGRPRYLDPTVAVTPALALNALTLELARMGQLTRALALGVLSAETPRIRQLQSERGAIDQLLQAISEFLTKLQRHVLPATVARELPQVLRAGQYYAETANAAMALLSGEGRVLVTDQPVLDQQVARFKAGVVKALELADPQAEGYTLSACEQQLTRVEEDHQHLKAALLELGAESGLRVDQLANYLEQLRSMRRIARQAVKGARTLTGLMAAAGLPSSSVGPDGAPTPAPTPAS